MVPSLSRRKLLQTSGVGSIIAIAGCVQSGLDEVRSDDSEPESSPGATSEDEDSIVVKDARADKGGGFLHFTIENNSSRTLRQASLGSIPSHRYGVSVYDIKSNSSIEYTMPISYDVSGGEKDIEINKLLFEGEIEDYTSNTWDLNARLSKYSSMYEDVELTFPLPDGVSTSDAKSVSIFENTLGEDFGSEVHKGVGDNITWNVGRFYPISEYDIELETLEDVRKYTVGPPEVQADFDLVDVSASETNEGMRIDSVTINIKSNNISNGSVMITRDKRSSARIGEESKFHPSTRAIESLKEPVKGEQTIEISGGAHFSAPITDGQKIRIHLLEGVIPFSATTSDEVLSYL